jgi:gas vesicle protein
MDDCLVVLRTSRTSIKKPIEVPAVKNLLQRTDAMSHNKWSNKYTTFAVGIGVGALLALLFAPSSGEETRDYISSSVKKGVDDIASTGKRWTSRTQETVSDVKASVAGAVEAGQEAYRTVRDA